MVQGQQKITFLYNQGENYDVGKCISFARPKSVSEPINDVEKKNKKPVQKYELTSESGRKDWMMSMLIVRTKINSYFLWNTCLQQLKLM